MRKLEKNFFKRAQIEKSKNTSEKILHKVDLSILQYIYSQITPALLSSLFCALIIFIGLRTQDNIQQLYLWSGLFLMITFLRVIAVIFYTLDNAFQKRVKLWRMLYIIGAALGGFSWGLAGILLLPNVDAAQQMLLILMLAGVTAGAVQLSAAIPMAAVLFLMGSILPFVLTIMMTKQTEVLHLFNFTFMLYLFYSIFLVIKAYRLIKYSIILTFENDTLLEDLEDMNVKLEQAATHDPLTKVSNRRLFTLTLDTLITYSKENNQKLAILFFDLDHFKKMNDYYGHEAGDHILLMVTHRLERQFRKKDRIARFGGDEFAMIIENPNNRNDVQLIAHKICRIIAKPIKWKEIQLQVSASVGVAFYPDDGCNEEELLHRADQCMYAAKSKGGNCFHFSDEIIP